MNWTDCISHNRTGKRNTTSSRTHYQRDFDRLIFSSSFRRLQNKTQVFPLPGNTFVHNRLTHSLEVASVGRSLGAIIGQQISNETADLEDQAKEFYKYDLSSVIAAGCLAHDLGNPSFGHSGEDAISNYFEENAEEKIGSGRLKAYFDEHEWSDLISFEGNANALHILTNNYTGKLDGGLSLTYSTLASILKYPTSSLDKDKSQKHLKKYGYLKKDIATFNQIAEQTSMVHQSTIEGRPQYYRHPFVYLVEAADDICYRIIDIEDAHRINILSTEEVTDIFMGIISDLAHDKMTIDKVKDTLHLIGDRNERISYLRAKTINALVMRATSLFAEHRHSILDGQWNNTLFDAIEADSKALVNAKMISIDKIYNHHSVIQVEITGYNVIYELLNTFVPLVIKEDLSSLERKVKLLIPHQYLMHSNSTYENVIGIVDFIAGMTDGYATEYYRKSKGIIIGTHQ